MENRLQKEYLVLSSVCDHRSRLGIPAVFSLFMDLATEHAAQIRLGSDRLAEHGLFWVTVRTKVRFHRRPAMMETVTAETWPEAPGKIGCNRYYLLRDGEEVLVEGKSEWAMMELSTGRPHRIAEVYPQDLVHLTDTVCDGIYARVPDVFSEAPEFARHRITSSDIDLGQHMNNAAYLRMVFGAFSCAELDAMQVREVDINYRLPCLEGEELTLRRVTNGNTIDIGVFRADGKLATTVRILCGE
ncbi:MAG: hypothetical protein E7458_05350 [Ruminococcaceae bacterium]|nr:hypothetical protein [Oscillospiraceae bacterium]